MPELVPGIHVLDHGMSKTWMAGTRPAIDSIRAQTPSRGSRLRLAGGLEHGGVERLARRLAGPDHELEGRK